MLLVAVVLACTVSAAAQLPSVRHANVVTETMGTTLSGTVDHLLGTLPEHDWICYSVAPRPGYRICGGTYVHGHCTAHLDEDNDGFSTNNSDSEEAEMAPVRRLLVFVRGDKDGVARVRCFTDDCDIDANSRTIHWLGEANGAQSVALMEKIAGTAADTKRDREEVQERAVSAIAVHADPSALAALDRLEGRETDKDLRSNIVFWIGQSNSDEATAILRRVIDKDPSSDVQEEAVFSLSQNNVPGATDALIEIARSQRDPELRNKAMFWLSQKGGAKVADVIRSAADNDPDSDVREQSIFALSQLPDSEGVPMLIAAARENRNSEVRSKALFWLSQKAGKKIADVLKDATDDDPDADVREQAVFALSQLPDDQGVPALIEVARKNKHSNVREKAIFWLGQTDDPRALSFFEEILTH
jgi:HEAT repeat protein